MTDPWALDYVAPWAGFVVPGRGPTPMSDWSLRAEHLAERNRLVFIVSLGETILILGFTLSAMEALSAGAVAATVLGFVLLVLLWWIYFDHMAPGEPDDPTRSAEAGRAAFAYGHAAMVGGAIVVAVAIELVAPGRADRGRGADGWPGRRGPSRERGARVVPWVEQAEPGGGWYDR